MKACFLMQHHDLELRECIFVEIEKKYIGRAQAKPIRTAHPNISFVSCELPVKRPHCEFTSTGRDISGNGFEAVAIPSDTTFQSITREANHGDCALMLEHQENPLRYP